MYAHMPTQNYMRIKVSSYSSGRKFIEIPKPVRDLFNKGEEVFVYKKTNRKNNGWS